MTDRPGEHRDERDPAEEHQGPVVRDKRRIDPTTGEVREPAAGQPATRGATTAGAWIGCPER